MLIIVLRKDADVLFVAVTIVRVRVWSYRHFFISSTVRVIVEDEIILD
jgi:hypothetical protein